MPAIIKQIHSINQAFIQIELSFSKSGFRLANTIIKLKFYFTNFFYLAQAIELLFLIDGYFAYACNVNNNWRYSF